MKTSTHYWTGRGTLCSLDNSVKQKANHTTHRPAVDCKYCLYQLGLNDKARTARQAGEQQ